MNPNERTPDLERLATLRAALSARAAGLWRAEGARLVLVAFRPAPDLPADVAEGFAAATESVPLSATGLGIVRAWNAGEPTVSRAEELPPDSGSGLWLRRFGAVRSVAVPLRDPSGRTAQVVSVALADDTTGVELVVSALVAAFGGEAASGL